MDIDYDAYENALRDARREYQVTIDQQYRARQTEERATADAYAAKKVEIAEQFLATENKAAKYLIANTLKDYPGETKQALAALTETGDNLVELDAAHERYGWCNVWTSHRARMIEQGALTEPNPAQGRLISRLRQSGWGRGQIAADMASVKAEIIEAYEAEKLAADAARLQDEAAEHADSTAEISDGE